MAILPGTRLGPYEILSAIGAGGMGEVYRARDTRLDRIVALKVSKQGFSERFEREARVIASLNHPHICQLYDVGPNYLVMEFLEGAPLRPPVPFEKVVEYSKQILDALDAAHRKGITHRDLKPANILLTRDGVKLLDFGLAKLKGGPLQDADQTIAKAVTHEGHIVGTLEYMSPEQLQGKEVDARSDLFSFGCLLYEMLSGKRAFHAESSASIIGAILEREPAPLQVVPQLDRVVRRALAKDPDNRFQTARDLKAALIWAIEEPAGEAAQARTKQWWLPWSIAGLAGLLATVFALFWLLRPRPLNSVSEFSVEPPPGVTFNYRITGSSISPDGKYLVYRASGESGSPLLWLRPVDSLAANPIPGSDGGDYPFWSPDSKSLAYFAGGKLEKLDLAGGPPLVLCDADAANAVAGGTWNRAGIILFGDRRGLLQISSQGGAPALLLKADPAGDQGPYGYPQFLPDGKHFLFFTESNDPRKEGIYSASLDRPQERNFILTTPSKAIYVPPFSGEAGMLLFVRGGSLVAQRFDAGGLRLEGDPALVAANLSVLPAVRAGAFWASETGTLVYRLGLGLDRLKLLWMGRDGRNIGQAAPEAAYTSLQLSPDGKQVAVGRRDTTNFTDLSDIWILNLDRGTTTRFTFGPEWNACPVWSPDGSQIAFTSSRAGSLQLYWKDPAGGGAEQQLTSDNPEYKCPMDWSRDGHYLIYGQSNRGVFDLWALPLSRDRKPVQIVPPPFDKPDAQFSPDGRWIAYTSNESGRYEVYVKAFPGAEGGAGDKWQVSNHGGRAPRWRRDGKEIFYLSLEDKMEAAETQLGAATPTIAAPRELFAATVPGDFGENEYPYDVTADGQRFLVEEAAAVRDSSPLTVVLNWQAGLKK